VDYNGGVRHSRLRIPLARALTLVLAPGSQASKCRSTLRCRPPPTTLRRKTAPRSRRCWRTLPRTWAPPQRSLRARLRRWTVAFRTSSTRSRAMSCTRCSPCLFTTASRPVRDTTGRT
jgi:hypothetical protein